MGDGNMNSKREGQAESGHYISESCVEDLKDDEQDGVSGLIAGG